MNMLRNQSNADIDDVPHTLRSDIRSPEISIPRSSPRSLSLSFSSLEISQSPTRALIQEPANSQSSVLDSQTPCTTAIICDESLCNKLAPLEMPTYTCTTNPDRSQQVSGHVPLASVKYEDTVSEDKNTDGQILVLSSQTFPSPSNSHLPESLSPGVTVDKNTLSRPTSHCHNIFSSSDMSPVFSSSSPSVQFFSFVIFHAPEDLELASRVCNDLEGLGIEKGTTFWEGFETPGISPLTCLENALENSAYIILLLTDAFLKANWGGFQSSTAMMNSIEKAHKLGSVIPFYPRLVKLTGKIPVWIRSLISLNENVPLFEAKVRNTFKQDVIIKQYELWKMEMNGTATNISIHCLMGEATAALPQQTQLPLSFHGQSPVIQISHASNVQIGNENSMNIQILPNAPQTDWDTNVYPTAENETPN